VRLRSHDGQQYPMAEAFEQEITKLYEAREQEREARRPKGAEVIEYIPRALPNFDQVPGSARRC
jgi:hypothetical protein